MLVVVRHWILILDQNINSVTLKPKDYKRVTQSDLFLQPSYITNEQLEEAKTNLVDLGFKVKYTDTILKKYGYLAGTDLERAEDLNNMFEDEEVKAIMAVRGGYGCARILPFLIMI